MKNYLKRRGIIALILVTIMATAFLPKQTSQWVILAALSVWALANIIIFFANYGTFKHFSFKRAYKKFENIGIKKEEDESNSDLKYALIQLSLRITEKLQSLYPESSWHWEEKPTLNLFNCGGRVRIITMNTGDFTKADVLINSLGNICIEMIETSSISDIIKKTYPEPERNIGVDPKMWYEQKGKQALTGIITELNSQGVKSLSIDEKGNVVLENSRHVDTLATFPGKNLWKTLIALFEEDELKVVETENSILLSW